MTLNDCKIYTIHGIEMIHIAEFAQVDSINKAPYRRW